MIEIVGDLFSQKCDAICIPTNGYVGNNGLNVMGAGVAGRAAHRWPFIKQRAGEGLSYYGNTVFIIASPEDSSCPYTLINFPTKPREVSDPDHALPKYKKLLQSEDGASALPGWMAKSSLPLIRESAILLLALSINMEWTNVVLPRPGCGLGGLSWEKEVRPALTNILESDTFKIISPK